MGWLGLEWDTEVGLSLPISLTQVTTENIYLLHNSSSKIFDYFGVGLKMKLTNLIKLSIMSLKEQLII